MHEFNLKHFTGLVIIIWQWQCKVFRFCVWQNSDLVCTNGLSKFGKSWGILKLKKILYIFTKSALFSMPPPPPPPLFPPPHTSPPPLLSPPPHTFPPPQLHPTPSIFDSRCLIAGPLCVAVCLKCNKLCSEVCEHGSAQYQHIADSPVLTRARATVPACLRLGQSSVMGHFNTTGETLL